MILTRSRRERPHCLRWPCRHRLLWCCLADGALGRGCCLRVAASSWNMTQTSSDVTFRGRRGPVSHISPLRWSGSTALEGH